MAIADGKSERHERNSSNSLQHSKKATNQESNDPVERVPSRGLGKTTVLLGKAADFKKIEIRQQNISKDEAPEMKVQFEEDL